MARSLSPMPQACGASDGLDATGGTHPSFRAGRVASRCLARRRLVQSAQPMAIQNYLIPTVIEQTHRGERGWDIFSRLLK